MKITQQMIDEWSEPEGYSDFNGSSNCRRDFYSYDDGIVIVSDNEMAREASPYGWRGKSKYIPNWVPLDKKFINMLKAVMVLPEPDMSLDEIEKAEKLMMELQRD